MGLLDEVIMAALSANAQSSPSEQAQPPRNTLNQDQEERLGKRHEILDWSRTEPTDLSNPAAPGHR